MKRRDISLTLAICGSLLVHGCMLFVLARHYVSGIGTVRLAGNATTQPIDNRAPIIIPAIPDSPNEIGESTGTGYASHASAGDAPLRAREANQDQAYLSLDPSGLFGTDGSSLASMSQAELPPAPIVPPTQVATPFGVRARELESVVPVRPLRSAQQKTDAPPGDPAPMSDSESDPFGKVGSVVFRQGSTEVRFGRKVKSVHPRLTLAAQYDLQVMRKATIVLALRIDETGKVVSADILRSSGANQLDLPTQQAMYQWWFEPAKNKDGTPMADVLVFTFSFIW